MANTTIRERLYLSYCANQSAVIGSIICLLAFIMVAGNAIFLQSGTHPQPLFSYENTQLNRSVSDEQTNAIPVRKVTTSLISGPIVPVPVARPSISRLGAEKNSSFNKVSDDKKIRIQYLLTELGFYSGRVDGLIGAQTRIAIKEFQKKADLPVSGKIGIPLLNSLEKELEKPKSIKGSKFSTEELRTENQRLSSEIVTRVQVGLINFGSRNITIDGLLGNKTKLAIENFQKRFDLEVTGLPSDKLIQKLVSVGALRKG